MQVSTLDRNLDVKLHTPSSPSKKDLIVMIGYTISNSHNLTRISAGPEQLIDT
jgi:hypothetical protein